MGARFEQRIALSCFNFAIFFPRGFSATTKNARLLGDPSVSLTNIVEALNCSKKLRELGLFCALTGFDLSKK
jgi:hypothetical protein